MRMLTVEKDGAIIYFNYPKVKYLHPDGITLQEQIKHYWIDMLTLKDEKTDQSKVNNCIKKSFYLELCS